MGTEDPQWRNPSGNNYFNYMHREPDEIRDEGAAQLREEQMRHEAKMARLKQEHEEKMRGLGAPPTWARSTFDKVTGWIFKKEDRSTEPTNAYTSASDNEYQNYGPGYCLVISNAMTLKGEADALAKAFLRLGFEVRMGENMREEEMKRLLQMTSQRRFQENCSFVGVVLSKGTSECVKTADGKKIRLRDIVDAFNPYSASSLSRKPKMFLFQCDVNGTGKQDWTKAESSFAPQYENAFVVCSTHKNFLPLLQRQLQNDPKKDVETMIAQVCEDLARTTTAKEAIATESTLKGAFHLL